MSERNSHQSKGKFIKRTLLSHQEILPSPEFKEELLGRMRAKIHEQQHDTVFQMSGWKRYFRIRIPLAAAASILIVFGCLWVFFGQADTATADFSDMLRKIRQAINVVFTASLQAPGESVENVQVYYTHTGQTRQAFPDGKVHVVNAESKRYLVLTPSEKRAVFRSFDPETNYYTEPLDILCQAADSTGEYIRDEEIQGQKVSVYQLFCEEGFMTIWVDQEKQLPVRILRHIPMDNGRETICRLENFQWNLPISDTLFSLDVPEGYALEDTATEASERDLVFLLQFLAEANENVFPGDVSPQTVIPTIYRKNKSSIMKTTVKGTYISKTDQNTKKIGRRCLKGLAFIRKFMETGSWHYIGEGVQLGDETSLVCYWNSPATNTFQAIFGDLTVKEYPIEEQDSIVREFKNAGK